MEKEIGKGLGSWDLEVVSFSYLVVYLEREVPRDLLRQNFFPSKFFENTEPSARWGFKDVSLRFCR